MKYWNPEIEHLTKQNYAPEVVQGIKALQDMLDEESALKSAMDDIVYRYIITETLPMADALAEIKQLAEQFQKNEYSLDLLLILGSLPRLHEKYVENGISDEIFYESMDDIRCKVNECVECKGVVGTFVADWYDRFFKLTCFAYGRFQYEVMTYEGEDFTMASGKTFKAGDKYINMHIPSRGIPLTDEVRLASYKAAYPHFSALFEDGIVIFEFNECSFIAEFIVHEGYAECNLSYCCVDDEFEALDMSDKTFIADKTNMVKENHCVAVAYNDVLKLHTSFNFTSKRMMIELLSRHFEELTDSIDTAVDFACEKIGHHKTHKNRKIGFNAEPAPPTSKENDCMQSLRRIKDLQALSSSW